MDQSGLLTVAETVKQLGVSRQAIYLAIKEGRLTKTKRGKRTYIVLDEKFLIINNNHSFRELPPIPNSPNPRHHRHHKRNSPPAPPTPQPPPLNGYKLSKIFKDWDSWPEELQVFLEAGFTAALNTSTAQGAKLWQTFAKAILPEFFIDDKGARKFTPQDYFDEFLANFVNHQPPGKADFVTLEEISEEDGDEEKETPERN